ncbi:Uncharacterised protein [[Clostridium] symbiosum]|nr:Uncharacterised protein [[Clostridium] symbiosum]
MIPAAGNPMPGKTKTGKTIDASLSADEIQRGYLFSMPVKIRHTVAGNAVNEKYP